MKFFPAWASLIISFFLLQPNVTYSSDNTTAKPVRPQSSWSTSVRGGVIYQFDTELDEGGSYSSGRYNIEVGQSYGWSRRDTVTLAVSYTLDSYDFQNGTPAGMSFGSPWDKIHTFSISAPLRKGIGSNWTAFLIPSLRSTGESGANFDDTITGGGLTGVSYKFGDRLTIGPGLGVYTQLEESATIFPVLIINWKITEKLSLDTGGGLAATLGPGLTLRYKANQKLRFAIGARYEKFRFRLDKDGDVASGIGEDSSFPLFANCTYNIKPKSAISLVVGLETAGELKIENSKGDSITEESSDPGIFTGITFNMKF